jgi:hypothetical protein
VTDWLPLLVLPLALGLLFGRRPDPTGVPWRWRVDGPLAVGAGAAAALLGGLWTAQWFILDGPYVGSDFPEYCATVGAFAQGLYSETSTNRSLLATAPAGLLARRLGVIDGLGGAALLGLGATGAGVYAWGRAAHGRLAGALGVLALVALGPVVALGRSLTLYPTITGAFALGTGVAAVAVRWPRTSTLVVGAIGAGLCFLVDLRGLPWGLAALGVLGVAAARGRRPLVGLALVAGLTWGAWQLGPLAYPAGTRPLEGQVDLPRRLRDAGIPVPPDLPRVDTTYIWGRTDPRDIPRTLHQLGRQAAAAPPALRDARQGRANREKRVLPIVPVGVGAAALALLSLARGRDRLPRALVVVGLSLPWLASLRGAVELQQSTIRFLGSALPVMGLALGVAGAALVHVKRPRGRRVRPLALAGGVVLGVLLVLGILPSWLSPDAPWRTPIMGSIREPVDAVRGVRGAASGPQALEACIGWLEADAAAGRPVAGRLHGGIPAE